MRPSSPRSFLLAVFHLLPIREERVDAPVRQWVIEELVEHAERQRDDISAHERRLDHVLRMPRARDDDLRIERVVLVDIHYLADDVHARVSDVVQTSDEWADERRARLGRHESLVRGEDERAVRADAEFAKLVAAP